MTELSHKKTILLTPLSLYYFDANFHKPDYFPSSDAVWEEGRFWVTMLWRGQELGLKFENKGTTDTPEIEINIYSQEALTESFINNLVPELRWRYNFDSDISEFYERYHGDKVLGPVIEKWKGMKPRAAISLYETLIVYIVLQNATVRRTVQMMENLFQRFGKQLSFDGRTLSVYWEPEKMAEASEQELRDLKLGYRAKFLTRITEQFVRGEVDEFALRQMDRKEVRAEILNLYGIGPASVDYLLFEHFYFYDTIETVPPWEQKILSKLIFNEESVPVNKIMGFFKKFEGWEQLAYHYIWEDLFWKRKNEQIDWLEKEIRL